MARWFLVALLYADGQSMKQIAAQLCLSPVTVAHYVMAAKGHMLGHTGVLVGGRPIGHGTKLDLRAALVEDGHLA